MALVQVAHDVADAYVVHHPHHDPWRHHWTPPGLRQPATRSGKSHEAPMYTLEYGTLKPTTGAVADRGRVDAQALP